MRNRPLQLATARASPCRCSSGGLMKSAVEGFSPEALFMDDPPPKAPKADIQRSVEETIDADTQQKWPEQGEAAVEIVGDAVMTRRQVRFQWPCWPCATPHHGGGRYRPPRASDDPCRARVRSETPAPASQTKFPPNKRDA